MQIFVNVFHFLHKYMLVSFTFNISRIGPCGSNLKVIWINRFWNWNKKKIKKKWKVRQANQATETAKRLTWLVRYLHLPNLVSVFQGYYCCDFFRCFHFNLKNTHSETHHRKWTVVIAEEVQFLRTLKLKTKITFHIEPGSISANVSKPQLLEFRV